MSLILTGRSPCVYFFARELIMYVNILYAIQKSFELNLAKTSFSYTGLVKYRVYNEMYARTRTASKGCVRKSVRTVKVPKNTVTVATC